MLNRDEMMSRLRGRGEPFDLLVIGGGATGLGIAVDASARGYAAALIEREDFGKGTSSRSTKLAHGGVRYLAQGNVSLVIEALRERGRMYRNAPHLVHDLKFIVPHYAWWEPPWYGVGLKVYDMLAGRYGFGRSRLLSRRETVEAIPTVRGEGLRGGVLYYDGQFDDARLLVNLAQTAEQHGGVLANYCEATALVFDESGAVVGAEAFDAEAGDRFEVRARAVVNATGPFADGVRRLAEPGAAPMISPSQGVHLVLPREFLPSDAAIMVPRTRDGRVMFAIPWRGRALLGTTDTPIDASVSEPIARAEEVAFILETAGECMNRAPTRGDVLSVFTGIRPLVRPGDEKETASISRDHTIHIGKAGLVTIAGGKWTTYRKMAEDCVDQAAVLAGLDLRPCPTKDLAIHGSPGDAAPPPRDKPWAEYGVDAGAIQRMIDADPGLGEPLDARLPLTGAHVRWAAEREMARTVEDVLSRRTRCLLLDAGAAVEAAPAVADILAGTLGRTEAWRREQVEAFSALAANYRLDVAAG